MENQKLKLALESAMSDHLEVLYGLSGNSIEGRYLKGIHYYLTDNRDALGGMIGDVQREADQTQEGNFKKDIADLFKIRLAIRQGELRSADIRQFAFHEGHSNIAWLGERKFVSGMGFESVGDAAGARDTYLDAAQLFKQVGMEKRAVRSIFNALMAESRIKTDKQMIYDMLSLCKIAEQHEVNDVAGMGYNNLAQELHKMGAFKVAQRLSDKAIDLIAKSMYGSKTYYLAVCNRAHIHADMGLRDLAVADYTEASLSQITEIRYAIGVLNRIFRMRGIQLPEVSLGGRTVRTWELRLNDASGGFNPKNLALSDIQNRLIEILLEGPQTRREVAQKIYADQDISIAHAEKKVSQIIYKIKLRNPIIVNWEGESLRLSSKDLDSEIKRDIA